MIGEAKLMRNTGRMGIGALLLLTLGAPTQCRADLDVSVIAELNAGIWTYTYTVDNSAGTEYAFDFLLTGLSSATIGGSPTGWDPTQGPTSATWDASSDNTYWVGPTASLGGFVLTNSYAPTTVSWTVDTDADNDFFTFDGSVLTGTVDGPSAPAVPEPSALALFAVGLGALFGRRRYRLAPAAGGERDAGSG